MFDHVAVGLIRRLCDEADCSIVLSSTWRLQFTSHEVANALDLPVMDSTPVMTGIRGLEINAWLEKHPEVTQYAIVDDNSDMLESQMPHFVQTDIEKGLSLRNFLDLKQKLGGKLDFMEKQMVNGGNPEKFTGWAQDD